ncbi:DNA double-strand break repair Rad50 ATPase [Pyrococcus abyssi GE5] [Rhizoctonia solani]|uniref:DNA double-strand break repair Rad50 ATPase [Pyrococcus abyssi GE5] n=1 Tax=Rhizoctonia solani TaxID=456999 RepID=A0A0K6GIK8_9AGAM|nr:DNA double-strand break repair Rad50 ATPase [Pyrococcus abyssi GE5] [Rhizoctonia solani]
MELVNKELAERQEKIASQDRELSQLRDELSSAKGKLSELHTLLYQRDETIDQLQQDLKSKEEALGHAYKMNEESANLRNQHKLMESKFLQQQAETATLQSKMDRVEYLMSQMMAVFSTDNGAQIYASRYPTTWVFLKYNGNYIIQLADKNRVLDLHHGSGQNGNVVHIFDQNGSPIPHRIWKLERLSDDAGNKEPPEAGEETANMNKELLQMQDELSSAKNELSELRSLLRQRDETIHRLQQDVKSKEEALNDANKANNETAQLRDQHVLLESKLSHQQMETAGLQAKVDRIEYLISQPPSADPRLGGYPQSPRDGHQLYFWPTACTFLIIMGQEISHSQYPPDGDLEPGTYRIFNALAGTAIQVSDHDPTKVVAWEQHDGENQQWFLQRSGEGYQLQNRRHRAYLSVCNTDNHALVYASRYPTTWVFLKSSGNYIVQFADRNRVLDLHNGLGTNGNEIHIWNVDGNNMAHRTWRLERLGDDFGNKELTGIQEEIVTKNEEISRLQGELSMAKQELSELHSLLYHRDETIRQLQQDLKLKNETPSHVHEANEESVHPRNQHSLSESKLSQQQTEIASLQAKMDRVEYLMSQMMSKPGGSSSTGATI